MFTWIFDLKDIKYEIAQFDIEDTRLDLIAPLGQPMLKVHFPAFKFWKFHAILDNNCWWLANNSKVIIEFIDFKVDFKIDLKSTQKGYLRPKVYGAVINFGKSSFYHENKFLSLFLN